MEPAEQAAPANQPGRPYLNFADLLRRTLGIDLFTCACGGRRSIVAFITSEEVARKALGLRPRDTSAAPRLRATGPPQLALALPWRPRGLTPTAPDALPLPARRRCSGPGHPGPAQNSRVVSPIGYRLSV